MKARRNLLTMCHIWTIFPPVYPGPVSAGVKTECCSFVSGYEGRRGREKGESGTKMAALI